VTVAVGFIPRIKVRQSGRRVATRESRVEACVQPSLRDEGSLFAIIRGLKSTATIVPSLRDAPAAAGEPLKAPEDWRSPKAGACPTGPIGRGGSLDSEGHVVRLRRMLLIFVTPGGRVVAERDASFSLRTPHSAFRIA